MVRQQWSKGQDVERLAAWWVARWRWEAWVEWKAKEGMRSWARWKEEDLWLRRLLEETGQKAAQKMEKEAAEEEKNKEEKHGCIA